MQADKSILATLETIAMSGNERVRAKHAVRTSAAVIAMLLGLAQCVGFGASRSK